VGAVTGRERDHEQQQAEGGHRHADPLPRPTSKPKIRSASTARIDDAGGQDGLDHRERGEREGGDMEEPCAGRDRHPDREPLGAEQAADGPQRVADVDLGSSARAPCL
jgi:hypothetical protein